MIEVRPSLGLLPSGLGVSFNSTPDTIHEGPEASEILSEESLEIKPLQGSYSILDLALVLVPTKIDTSLKKRDCKKNSVRPFGSCYVKWVLALLTEIVAVHVRYPVIHV